MSKPVVEYAMRGFAWFVNTRMVRSLRDGMMLSMPAIVVGTLCLLLYQLPNEQAAQFVQDLGIVPALIHGYTSTFAVTAVITTIGIGYTWAKNDGWDPFPCGIIAFCAFLILIPDQVVVDALGNTVDGLDKSWLGAQGMIGAIISGWVTGAAYSWFMKKNFVVRMPACVPDGTAAAFVALIPALGILLGMLVVYQASLLAFGCSPIEVVYTGLQIPLQGLTDTLGAVIAYVATVPLLWFFGVHGNAIIGSIMGPINQTNMLDNQRILDQLIQSGMSRNEAVAALGAHGAHVLTEPFMNCFNAVTGSGITLGLVIFMVFFAKSEQMRHVGKLGFGSGIFNINEPVLFGTPVIMNPKLLAPFVLSPLFGVVGAYALTKLGFMPYTTGVNAPWTTPPILMGLINIGWQGALWQFVEIVGSFLLYLPFARSVDREYLRKEQQVQET